MSEKTTNARVVTVSATYGAAGSVVGPRLAERLGLPFLDRLVSSSASGDVVRSAEGLIAEERRELPMNRLLWHLSGVAAALGTPVPPVDDTQAAETIRAEIVNGLQPVVDGAGAVVLGRAGSVVLADHPLTYHVRLDGPPERRLLQAMLIEGIDEATARQRQSAADRTRSLYVQRLYDRNSDDASLYHLVVDSTVLSTDDCVEVLALAAMSFWR